MNGGVVRCAAAAVLFGVAAPLAKPLTEEMGPFTLAGLLYVGAAAAVVPWAARHRPDAVAWRRSAGLLTVAVVAGGLVGPVLLAAGLAAVPAATASLLLNLELVFTIVVAGMLFDEQLGRRVVAGAVLVTAAGLLLVWSGDVDVRWGALLIVAACAAWAVDNSATAAVDQVPAAAVTVVKGVAAGGTNLVIGVVADGGVPPAAAVAAALIVGAAGYGASITLWVSGARDLGAARAQLVFAAAPFIGAVTAWLVLGGSVTVRELAAFAVAAVGVAAAAGSGHDHVHVHEPLDHVHGHRHDDGHHGHVHDPPVAGRHTHGHRHVPVTHAHRHVPDVHHRHRH